MHVQRGAKLAALVASFTLSSATKAQSVIDLPSRDNAAVREPERVAKESFTSVTTALRGRVQSWQFLSEKEQSEILSELSKAFMKGEKAESQKLSFLPGGRALVQQRFALKADSPLTAEQIREEFNGEFAAQVRPLIQNIRHASGIGAVSIDCSLEGSTVIVSSILDAGTRYRGWSQKSEQESLQTQDGRLAILAHSLEVLANSQVSILTLAPQAQPLAAYALSRLRDHYESQGDNRLAALTQACILAFDRSGESHLRYVDLGPLSPDELEACPDVIKKTHADVEETIARIPPFKELLRRADERGSIYEVGTVLSILTSFEREAEICSQKEYERTLLEIANAGHRVAREAKLASISDAPGVAALIRKFFTEEFKHLYAPQANINGISQPLSLHVTDCSSLSLIAIEQFGAAGVAAGIEIIGIKNKDGENDPTVMAHAYTFVDTSEGRRYFDFSLPKDHKYVFTDRQEIWRLYAGERAGDIMVVTSSADAAEIIQTLAFEPFLDARNALRDAFAKDRQPLAVLLGKNPELTDPVRHLLRGYRAYDAVVGTKQAERLERGSVEDLDSLLGGAREQQAPDEGR